MGRLAGIKEGFIDWLNQNKEWLFQGIGVTLLIGIAAIIKTVFIRNGVKAAPRFPPRDFNYSQLGAARVKDDETNHAGPANSSQSVSKVSAADIHEAIQTAPPLQRDLVAKRFEGIFINWETDLRNATEDGEFIRLMLRAKPATDMFDVWCRVKKSDYRDLGILNYKTKVIVCGEITKAERFSVEIKDAHLTY